MWEMGRKECLCLIEIGICFAWKAGYDVCAERKPFAETTTGICAKLRHMFNRVRAAHQTKYAVRSRLERQMQETAYVWVRLHRIQKRGVAEAWFNRSKPHTMSGRFKPCNSRHQFRKTAV